MHDVPKVAEDQQWLALCGLVAEYGERARSGVYEHEWHRRIELWKAVQHALDEHERGTTPQASASRPPPWLAGLVRERLRALATSWSHSDGFSRIRRLEVSGLVEVEVDDEYVLAAVGGIGGRFEKGRARTLRDDPELRERVVWRFFEVEGGGEVSLANVDKFTAAENGWQTAFLELVADGTLPRDRVLDCALAALGRDFSAYRAGWYSRLVDALEPTTDELAPRQAQLRDLLRSSNGATVSWALRRVKALVKPGRLDAAATIPTLLPAAQSPAKTTALTAIKLTSTLLAAAPGAGAHAAAVATAGIGHPHADVQAAAAAVLAGLGDSAQLRDLAADLSPRVRRQLALDAGGDSDSDSDPAVPEHVTAGSDEVGSGGGPPSLVVADGRDVAERMAALLEDASDPIEVELGLAALAERPDAAALSGLTRRANRILERGPRERVVGGWLRGQLAHLVCTAAGERPPPPPAPRGAAAFLAARIVELEGLLADRTGARRLLATPTSHAGWIDPGVFAERLGQGRHSRLDLIQALLRLGPDGRAAALASLPPDLADRLPDGCSAPTTWALGGPEPVQKRAVLRTRRSASDQAVLAAAARGRGRAEPLSIEVSFRSSEHTWHDRRGPHRNITWHWSYLAGATGGRQHDEPTAVVSRKGEGAWSGDFLEDYVPWLGLLWPHDAEWLAYTVGDAVLAGALFDEVQHDAVPALRALARHPGRAGTLSATVLAAGLSGGRTDQRVVAVDAVLELAQRGTLTADVLAEGLRSFAEPAQLKRWAGSVGDLVRSGPLGADLALHVLYQAVPALTHERRGLADLLGVVLDTSIESGAPPPAEVRGWLEGFSGSSLAARTAQRLLAL